VKSLDKGSYWKNGEWFLAKNNKKIDGRFYIPSKSSNPPLPKNTKPIEVACTTPQALTSIRFKKAGGSELGLSYLSGNEAVNTLKTVKDFLDANPNHNLLIVGKANIHDSQIVEKASGWPEALALDRAQTVKDDLVRYLGISSDRVITSYESEEFGEQHQRVLISAFPGGSAIEVNPHPAAYKPFQMNNSSNYDWHEQNPAPNPSIHQMQPDSLFQRH
jgi:hypothetical protein